MSKPVKTELEFFDCQQCKGFGYVMNPAKEHVPCTVCHNHPSMYAMLDQQVLYWGTQISEAAVRQRKIQQIVRHVFRGVLLLCGIGGMVTLVFAAYQFYNSNGTLLNFFTTPNRLLALFWCSIWTDLILYYHFEREGIIRHQLRYTAEGAAHQRIAKRPANPTYPKFHQLPRHVRIDIAPFFTPDALSAIEWSAAIARKLGHHQITPLHLFSALLRTNAIATIMTRLGMNAQELYAKIGSAMSREGMDSGRSLDMSVESYRALFYAYEEAVHARRRRVDTMEILIALVHADPWIAQIFDELNITDRVLHNVIEWIHIQRRLKEQYMRWKAQSASKPKGVMDRALTARPSPLLQSISQDYTALARQGGFFPPVGRAAEMEQLLRIIQEPTGNVLLVGAPGVGKSTLLEGLAQRMTAEEVPSALQDKRLVVLDPGALIADARGTGVLEGRMQRIILEIAQAKNIVLGVEDIHHLLNMRSGSGSEDAGSMLMNALSRGFVKVVATTTTQEYEQFIQNHGAFVRRFQVVNVAELTRDDAILVLEARAGSIEYKHRVFFSYSALESAVDLSSQFIQDRFLPAKALDVLTEAAAYAHSARGDDAIVVKEDVAEVIAEKTNVQVTAINDDERQKLLNLESIMHERIVGQDEAVNAVAGALRRAREGLRQSGRPIANFLFLGPTGVGKTEMAKTIAEVYFGNEENMIRLDMSEYQEAAAVQKLIGGSGEQGLLTQAVRRKPFALVLLDEFEKAHPQVLNIFLQAMDDGRLTDGTGYTVDLSNAMIIATSNAATQQIQNSIAAGVSQEQIRTRLLEEFLPHIFSPELVNRFDSVVVFTPLGLPEVELISQRLIAALVARLEAERGIVLNVLPAAVAELARAGYDPLYGARPLKRVITERVEDAVAKLLLSQQVNRRDTIILGPGGQVTIEHADRL
ncbi:MAG: ATP-dependent Clp protease ATP-binding subunit [Candidatus Kerfeldbacteria bacterium]|nr:ATP-dependent Clp protease ATP-binding subunit [Candidatus Kerfeldbacteria bacterium]